MEYYKGYICVTFDELTSKEDTRAVMSVPNYKQLVKRNKINVVRKGGGLEGYALVDFHSLPERFKEAIINKYGSPEDVIKAKSLSDRVIEDSKARNYFATYILANGDNISEDKIDEYTMNASVLNEIIKLSNEAKSRQKSLGGKGGVSTKEIILKTIEDLRLYPGHTLPSSWARINQKIREYKANGYEVLIQGYLGNNNSVKLTDDMGKQAIALKRSKVPQYTNDQIFERLNEIALIKGWECLKSKNTLISYFKRPEIMPLWYDAVCGSNAAKQKFNRKHKTDLPTRRDTLWYGDGTKLNLYYKKYEGGKMKRCSTNVYVVMDAASEVFLGYSIADAECFETQYMAWRSAVETAGCRPFEVVYDNQGGHKSAIAQEFFSKICRVHRPTAPYNGSSKTIEAAFGRFQMQYLHSDWRFTGQNVNAKGEYSAADMQFIDANPDSLYTLSELKEAFLVEYNKWNYAKHPSCDKTRMEVYLETQNPETQQLTEIDMINIFWEETERESTFTTSGITISVDNKEYTYEVFDAEGMPDLSFRAQNTYRKFIVKYDPLNMTRVRLYVKDSTNSLKFVSEAAPYAKIHRAIQDQTPEEASLIRKIDELQKQQMADHYVAMATLEMEHGVAPEQHGLNRPRISGIPAKSLDRYMEKAMVKGNEEPQSVGQSTKMMSNTTSDQLRCNKF